MAVKKQIEKSDMGKIAAPPPALQQANVSCRASWKDDNGMYVSSTSLYLGKLKIATLFYDGVTSKGDTKKYKVTSPVRGIKEYLGHFETEEEAAAMCSRVATTVLNMLSHGS